MVEIVNDYRALLSGDYWGGLEVTGKPTIVTYSFPTSAADYVAGMPGFSAATAGSFQAFSDDEKDQARAALKQWSDASGLVFIEVAPGQGDINFQNVDFRTTSYDGKGGVGFYPFGNWDYFSNPSFRSDGDGSGDVFMNTNFQDASGKVDAGTLLHEIGHALGLKHPTEDVYNYATGVDHDQELATDDPTLTIMSEQGDTQDGSANDDLKQLDKDAIAYIYGAAGTGRMVGLNQDASGSNSAVASWSWNSSSQTLSQTGFSGDDVIRGSSVTDVIDGLEGNNKLFGLNGNDTLTAGSGDDMLDGGPGADRMTGGAGNDTYVVDNAGDVVVEAASGGTDTVLAYTNYTLADNVETLQVLGAYTGTGNALANTIYGDGTYADTLYGIGGNDTIVGGAAGDTIDGGTGADAMYGGAGNDTYYVDNAGDRVTEAANGGSDLVYSSVSYNLAGQYIETLTLAGTANINATGNTQANTLNGNSGANVLNGLGGNDTMAGGAGNDTYYVDSSNDHVVEGATGGNDLVFASASFNLAGQYIETLTLTGTANINATGNSQANTLNGNSGANVLNGLGGNDTMAGGAGNDTYYVDSANDRVIEGATGGNDIVYASASFSLAGQYIETLTLTGSGAINAIGNTQANTLVGNTGNNVFTGGAGADRFVLDVGFGHDTVADMAAGSASGHDVIDFASSVFASFADVMGHAQQSGTDTIITDSSGDTLTLKNVTATALVAADFTFH